MSAQRLFNANVTLPSLEELYEKHREEVAAAPSGSEAMRELLLRAFSQVFHKLRLQNLAAIPVGSTNIQQELFGLIGLLLQKIKRGDPEPHVRLEFKVGYDPGAHPRQVSIDITPRRTRLTIKGQAPKDGVPGSLKEKGRYAAERRARLRTRRMDHYTTGEFVETSPDELLAVIDNTRIKGEAGIDIRGMVVKPREAQPYLITLGEGVGRRETAAGKLELVSRMSGLVKTKYDGEGHLRYLGVEQDLRLGELGLRSGGHVKSGRRDGRGALKVERAEFRSIPPAFEARTKGEILVKELVQGIVVGTAVTVEMVNQAPGKYLVATEGELRVNRSLQGGLLCAPRVVVGNGKVVAAMINTRIRARNHLFGRRLLLSGRSSLLLGDDRLRECLEEDSGCLLSGQSLFVGRERLLRELEGCNRELEDAGRQFNNLITGHLQGLVEASRPLNRELARKSLDALLTLQRELMVCEQEEEGEVKRQVVLVLAEIGLENPLPVLRNLDEKKRLHGEVGQRQEQLAAITQPITVELEIEKIQDGATFTVRCWRDTLELKGVDRELLIERPLTEERLATLPTGGQKIAIHYDYQRDLLVIDSEKKD